MKKPSPGQQQNWYHIYDKIDQYSSSKHIRMVYDIYTNKDYFEIDFKEKDFVGMEIKGRNVNSELAYIEDDGIIRVSLGPMNRWPDAPIDGYKHVKIDVGYTILNADFDTDIQLSKLKFTGYTSIMEIEGKIHPEFHLNLAKGLKLVEDSVKAIVFSTNKEGNLLKTTFSNNQLDKLPKGTKKAIHTYKNPIENKYTILLNVNVYNKLSLDSNILEVFLEYSVKNETKFFAIFIGSAIVLLLTLIELYHYNELYGYPFIALLSIIALYLTLKKEHYEIPFETWVYWSIIFSLVISTFKYIIFLFS